jgi:hypothetical protein
LKLRAREILIPLVVGLIVALLQALFSGLDLIRIILYFFVGLGLAGLGLLAYRFVRGARSRVSLDDIVRGARMEANRRKTEPALSPTAQKVRIWADVRPEDLMAIDDMKDLTRNERDRLLEPYVGQWFSIDGVVDDVAGTADRDDVVVYVAEREHRVAAHVKKEKERASSLRKGIAVRIDGSFRSVQGYLKTITLGDCEFVAPERRQETIVAKEAPQEAARQVQSVEPAKGPAVVPFRALEAEHGTEFSGLGVGKTETFHVTKQFGFRWAPSTGILIGGLHGTLNGNSPHLDL